jgi:hypothetical protein
MLGNAPKSSWRLFEPYLKGVSDTLGNVSIVKLKSKKKGKCSSTMALWCPGDLFSNADRSVDKLWLMPK